MLMPPPDEKNVTSLNEAVTSMASEKGNFKWVCVVLVYKLSVFVVYSIQFVSYLILTVCSCIYFRYPVL